ncbi:MAG: glycoside hydrolase family 92 protein [Pontiellaceae bacterium]|jgi:putative alpha-1,2-mannosidase|nr:glycoside hydrolase family 92 protein [Pontiellaceae bacterium]
MWPRDAAGQWIELFDPASSGGQGARDYFTENNGMMFNWHVRHDLSGLFELMGGRSCAEKKLDELFRNGTGCQARRFGPLLQGCLQAAVQE